MKGSLHSRITRYIGISGVQGQPLSHAPRPAASCISRAFPPLAKGFSTEPLFRLRIDSSRFHGLGSEDFIMLSWVVTFLIVALIAGVLGFGGIAGASVEIAKTIFFIAVILFLVSAVVGLARGRTRV